MSNEKRSIEGAARHNAEHVLAKIAEQAPDGETEAELEAGTQVMLEELTNLSIKWFYLGLSLALRQSEKAARIWEAASKESPEFAVATNDLVDGITIG